MNQFLGFAVLGRIARRLGASTGSQGCVMTDGSPEKNLFVPTALRKTTGGGQTITFKVDGSTQFQVFQVFLGVEENGSTLRTVQRGFAAPAGSTVEVSGGGGGTVAWGYLARD